MKARQIQREKSSFLERTGIVWKTTLGSVIAWEAARLLGSKHPYLAPLTLILCIQTTIGQSLRFSLYRCVGTVIGVLLIGFFAKGIPVTAWALGIALFISTSLMKLLRMNDTIIHQVALSILFVLYFESHSAGYAWDRARDTLIGSLVAVVFVTVFFPTNETRKSEQSMRRFVQDFAQVVDQTGQAVHDNDFQFLNVTLKQRLIDLFNQLQKMNQSLTQAKQSLRFNLYAAPSATERVSQQMNVLQQAYIRFTSLAETLTTDFTKEQRDKWSQSLRSIAVDLRDWPNHSQTVSAPKTTPNVQLPHLFNEEAATYELQRLMEYLRGNVSVNRPRAKSD
ncbi:FUSC family protein [Alicyclobacillus dauci]|uniref:FUSC family protein n=1 Tax=Alicyclobacillus dauci TaxID=1475485 RepID=A0ABY6Z767_9BACL|nr:FUSC family protein [Alicyclobacillus dauci]WAH38730.1 FUSC family protein [Alicyclobacillus dauci]